MLHPLGLPGSNPAPSKMDGAKTGQLGSGKGSAVGWGGGTQSPPDVVFWAQNLEPATPRGSAPSASVA